MDNITWMLPEDLVVAKEKLQAIDPFVAYPDWIMDDIELTLAYEGVSFVQHGDGLLTKSRRKPHWPG